MAKGVSMKRKALLQDIFNSNVARTLTPRPSSGSTDLRLISRVDDMNPTTAATAPSGWDKSLGRLPQELRDQIYSYLLLADNVKYHPKRDSNEKSNNFNTAEDDDQPDYRHLSRAHSYRFQTQLMLVSKTLAAEAREYLYTQNTFVVFDFVNPHYAQLLFMTDVPIVKLWAMEMPHAKKGLVRKMLKRNYKFDGQGDAIMSPEQEQTFVNWSVRLRMDVRRAHARIERLDTSYLHRVVMMFQDLPRLFEMLRLDFLTSHVSCVTVVAYPSEPQSFGSHIRGETDRSTTRRTRLEVRRSTNQSKALFRELTSGHLGTLMQGMRVVTGIGYYLEVTGVQKRTMVSELRNATAPTIIWNRAWDHEVVELAKNMRQRVDAVCPQPDEDRLTRLKRILNIVGDAGFSTEEWNNILLDLNRANIVLNRLFLVAEITMEVIRIRDVLGKYDDEDWRDLRKTLKDICEVRKTLPENDGRDWSLFDLFVEVVDTMNQDYDDPNADAQLDCAWLRDKLDAIPEGPSSRLSNYDRGTIRAFIDQGLRVSHFTLRPDHLRMCG